MLYIDLEGLRPQLRDEIEALERAKSEVVGETDPEERKALFDRYQSRWKAVRDAFETHSNGKCWYVECKSDGADNDIDHYRPKSSVADDPTHPGYYWLAFEWTNLRLSCQRANRPRRDPGTALTGGKRDHFPLLNPEGRARAPGDDLSLENPAIIDPTNVGDVAMVTFGPNGDVDLVPNCKGRRVPEEKLRLSIRHLHLNWPKFREARVRLYNRIERFVHRGEELAPHDFGEMDTVAQSFLDICSDLASWTRPQEEYSRAARAYVEMFGDRWWIRDIVLRIT